MESLNIAVLTVSDTRTPDTDTSGRFLCDAASEAGHKIVDHSIVIDDIYKLRAAISNLIADDSVQVVLVTGGTGFGKRDATPDALVPLFDTRIDGFGELFRQLSYEEIGTSTIQSRAFAGLANNTLIFCMPGSTGACRTGWDRILREQLDSTFKPCNFAEVLRTGEGHR